MARDDVDVPPIMVKCCEAIEKYGLDQQGLYRINGTHPKVQKLKERLDRGTSGRYIARQERAGYAPNTHPDVARHRVPSSQRNSPG